MTGQHRSTPAQPAPPSAANLTDLPQCAVAGLYYREHHRRADAIDLGCWWFASTTPGDEPGGRFDRHSPEGTCYFGQSPGVAARERCGRFLAARRPVPRSHIAGRVVSTVEISLSAVADLVHPDAALLGVTAELAAGNDYGLSVQWADTIGVAGFSGIRYAPRFTPGQECALAVFGPEGAPQSTRPPLDVQDLAATLLDLGYDVEDEPAPSDLDIDDEAPPAQWPAPQISR